MIRYLIKNNFKLMLRNKCVLAMMLIGPILVIALLSSAFEDMMASYETADEFKAGYCMSEGSIFEDDIDAIKSAGKEAGIEFENYPDGDEKSVMEQNNLAGFIAFDKENYTVYESADYENEGKVLEYFMEQIESQASTQVLNGMFGQGEEIKLPMQKVKFMPAIEAKNYYGIIEVVYFIWCGIISVAAVLSSEKKNGIEKRFEVSGISQIGLYFAKWIPAVLTTICETAVTVLLTVLLFGISWGSHPAIIFILFVAILGALAFGMLMYAIFNNLAVTVVALFTAVWFMGFLGGSFETYMFSTTPDSLKNLSPIYHVNRALVEYSCMGSSDYAMSSILYMSAIAVVCSILTIIINLVRKKGRA